MIILWSDKQHYMGYQLISDMHAGRSNNCVGFSKKNWYQRHYMRVMWLLNCWKKFDICDRNGRCMLASWQKLALIKKISQRLYSTCCHAICRSVYSCPCMRTNSSFKFPFFGANERISAHRPPHRLERNLLQFRMCMCQMYHISSAWVILKSTVRPVTYRWICPFDFCYIFPSCWNKWRGFV